MRGDLFTFCLLMIATGLVETNERQRRYLIFTKDTQWGVFATISVPLEPGGTVSAAWFFEANYYNVDNSSYLDPLLGDIEVSGRQERQIGKKYLTRHRIYTFIEAMLEKHDYPGPCLLRTICENAASRFEENGVLGDLLHLILSPSTSLSEDEIEDCYYEAEYWGLEQACSGYHEDCPRSPMDLFSLIMENYNIVT